MKKRIQDYTGEDIAMIKNDDYERSTVDNDEDNIDINQQDKDTSYDD